MKRILFLLLCLAMGARAQERPLTRPSATLSPHAGRGISEEARIASLLPAHGEKVPKADEGRSLSLHDAVTLAIEKNGDMVVERESVAIADANQRRAGAAYDPVLHNDVRFAHRDDADNSILSSASMTQLLRNGSTVTLFTAFDRSSDDHASSAGAEFRQPLLQNRRIDPARRAIRIAAVDRSRANESLRRVAAETIAATEHAYWNLVAARSIVDVRESALNVAEVQRDETRVRIDAGTRAPSDLAETTAEVERRRGELVTAIEARTRAENALKGLIARDASDPVWSASVIPSEVEGPAAFAMDVNAAITDALKNRPELHDLTLHLDRHDIEIASSIDRVRPQLDLVASYEKRDGALYEDDFSPDGSIGFSLALPIGNHAAKQDVAIARAAKRQTQTVLEQARQQVAIEVRNAAAAITSALQRIDATKAAREAAQTQLQAERDRFEAGASNNFFVLTRQNDLAAAQLAEIVALTDYQKARSELARATGGSV